MRSTLTQLLQGLHYGAASAYLIVRNTLSHGWYEAFEYSPVQGEDVVCPVKQLIGISVHEQTQ